MEQVFCSLDVRAEAGAPCDLNFPVELKGIESDIERLYINCFKDTVKENTSGELLASYPGSLGYSSYSILHALL